MKEETKLIGIQELTKEYGISRVKAYEFLEGKDFPVIRLGKRKFVMREVWEKYLEGQVIKHEIE